MIEVRFLETNLKDIDFSFLGKLSPVVSVTLIICILVAILAYFLFEYCCLIAKLKYKELIEKFSICQKHPTGGIRIYTVTYSIVRKLAKCYKNKK